VSSTIFRMPALETVSNLPCASTVYSVSFSVERMLEHEVQDHLMFQKQMSHILSQLQHAKKHLGIGGEGDEIHSVSELSAL
jgi:hypothetical protein